MIIEIDDREEEWVVKEYQKHYPDAEIYYRRLKVGDVIIDNTIAIENKWSYTDLHGSMNDKRLFKQLDNMIKGFEFSCLIITGDCEEECKSPYLNLNPKQVTGLMGSLMARGFPFSTPKDIDKYFEIVDSYIRHCKDGGATHVIKPKAFKHKTAEPGVSALLGVGVSIKQAEEIMKLYTLRELSDLSIKELTDVRGIGEKTAQKIKVAFY